MTEGLVGEEDRATELEGEMIVCIKYSIPSSLYLQLNWTQGKISSVVDRRVENSRRIWNMIMGLRKNILPRSSARTTRNTLQEPRIDGTRAK